MLFVYYLKGVLVGLGSVVLFYITLRYLLPSTYIGRAISFGVYALFHDMQQPLHATAGGHPSLLMHLWFWLWSMIIFAATLLIYFRR